jgi:hypothetical protein
MTKNCNIPVPIPFMGHFGPPWIWIQLTKLNADPDRSTTLPVASLKRWDPDRTVSVP